MGAHHQDGTSGSIVGMKSIYVELFKTTFILITLSVTPLNMLSLKLCPPRHELVYIMFAGYILQKQESEDGSDATIPVTHFQVRERTRGEEHGALAFLPFALRNIL